MGDSGIMWWDEGAPRKVNVKLSIVGRKKEFIHKFDLVFETDEVECWRDVAKLAGHQLRQRQESDRHLTSKEWAQNKFQPIVLFNRYGGEMSQEDLHEQCPPQGEIWVNAFAKVAKEKNTVNVENMARYRAKFAGARTRGDYLARKASIKLANKGKRGGRREAKKKARKHQNTQAEKLQNAEKLQGAEKLQDARKLTWKAQ